LFVGDRIIEIFQPSRAIGKFSFDKFYHLLGRLIRLKGAGRLDFWRSLLSENASIVLVEIPVTADRILTLHQDIMIPPHFAVEGFQQKGFAALGEGFEVVNGRHKMGIRPHIKLAIQAFGRRLKALKNAEVTGTHTDKPLWPRLICPSCDFRLEAAAIVGVIERYLVNEVSTIIQFARKMAHCRKE